MKKDIRGVSASHIDQGRRSHFAARVLQRPGLNDDDDDDNFRHPLEPGPSFKIHGGKRRGSGRKRKHEVGYDKARAAL